MGMDTQGFGNESSRKSRSSITSSLSDGGVEVRDDYRDPGQTRGPSGTEILQENEVREAQPVIRLKIPIGAPGKTDYMHEECVSNQILSDVFIHVKHYILYVMTENSHFFQSCVCK